jgi:2-polyprenyl-6-methoxyphenol hydroxylase-like FAD-dependent oxidoreductase
MAGSESTRQLSAPGAPVLIAGAGPTGLVLALWLTHLGIRVRIFDRAAEAGTTSRALAVQARTLEFYRQIDLDAAVVAGGVRVEAANLWVRGERRARVPLMQFGEGLSPFAFALVYPQDAHERLLIDRLAALGVTVERQTELLHFDQDGAGVRATVRRPDGREETIEAAYLAGCDGASSVVRDGLGIGFPGGTYTGLFYVADVDASGPVIDGQLHVDLEDADFVIVFPLRGDGRLRLVGTVHQVPAGGHQQMTFADVQDKAIEHVHVGVRAVNWFSTYRVHHRVANRFRDRRVFLLGDAAHIHSPVGGQGMNTGIGDAVNLAWKLAAVLLGEGPAALLDSYEPERIPFARRLVATTDRGFTIVTARGPFAQLVRTRLAPSILPWLFRLPAVRRFMFKTVSQTSIAYRESPISEGEAGRLRAGDRLPWVQLANGHDNFAPLTSLAWQAQVYGEATRDLRDACAALALPLHEFASEPAMERAGLTRNALYVVRPDGYLGLVDDRARVSELRRYLAAWTCTPADRAAPP